jgi:hypothetical protein
MTSDGSSIPSSRDQYVAVPLSYIYTGNTTAMSDVRTPASIILVYGGVLVEATSSDTGSSSSAVQKFTAALTNSERAVVDTAMVTCSATSLSSATTSVLTEYTSCLYKQFRTSGSGDRSSSPNTPAYGGTPEGGGGGYGGYGGSRRRLLQDATSTAGTMTGSAFIAVYQPANVSQLSSRMASSESCDVIGVTAWQSIIAEHCALQQLLLL